MVITLLNGQQVEHNRVSFNCVDGGPPVRIWQVYPQQDLAVISRQVLEAVPLFGGAYVMEVSRLEELLTGVA